ncbi:CRISPR-associated helicase Cas3' [Listeria ilorinensis]|uniref:CRISPR-associated helicase Cas3' n=1 Tax=Listeria ilorinensis TaxID=2867439 RepID=UPI001EF5EF83|nr:CRISPR-associated helicase Cas3' [Listeria ilorinensis]
MTTFYAKSKPLETIQQHTDKLLENYQQLSELYPEIKTEWELLYLACLLHDLGKMSNKFQEKIRKEKKTIPGEIPHNYLSVAFIDSKSLKKQGYTNQQIKSLYHAVAYHHVRAINFNEEEYQLEREKLAEPFEKFKYEKLEGYRYCDFKLSRRYFTLENRIMKEDGQLFFDYILLKGLLNRIDYAASAGILVEQPNDFLEEAMDQLLLTFQKKNSAAEWNELQRYMCAHQADNIVVVAETGMGKTEAGLLWLGNQKGFFTLPVRTSINAMYDRISQQILPEIYEKKLGLLHAETLNQYLDDKEIEDDKVDDYFERTRQLSLPLTICTIDQLFDFVYFYAGFEPKLATLSYSKVIIDEIQMYSPDLLSYLIYGLACIQKVGGKFCIMTATLPGFLIDYLHKFNLQFEQPEHAFISERVRHRIAVVPTRLEADAIIEKQQGKRVLVIANTVKEANRIYAELRERLPEHKISLLHSRFIRKDRSLKEAEIVKDGSLKTGEACIWIATQVVEASLDIDFDILMTELSDLNGLFQRMGRCYRQREVEEEPNVYIFNGGKKYNTGVGPVIDETIYRLSKEVLESKSGLLTEQEKLNMLDAVYAMEKLQGSQYLKSLDGTLDYLNILDPYSMDKKEVQQKFRNIDSTTVIPSPVYQEYQAVIAEQVEIIKDKQKTKHEKSKARAKLNEFQVALPTYICLKGEQTLLRINDYEKLTILACEYGVETGVQELIKDDDLFF